MADKDTDKLARALASKLTTTDWKDAEHSGVMQRLILALDYNLQYSVLECVSDSVSTVLSSWPNELQRVRPCPTSACIRKTAMTRHILAQIPSENGLPRSRPWQELARSIILPSCPRLILGLATHRGQLLPRHACHRATRRNRPIGARALSMHAAAECRLPPLCNCFFSQPLV